MTDGYDLARFVRAQAGLYPSALAELRSGTKRTHWMWFVFPQILGLGLSSNARIFAISGAAEARAYLAHDLLGDRLRESTSAMLEWVGKRSACDILGPLDALKFRSSMTLFEHVDSGDSRFSLALEGFCNGERDRATLDRLEVSSPALQ
ncbi:MAG: DUF1810 domain-containing protein [Erythrobacter sp.]|nr:MAG: DUF1810 domain-containing protein [Erythrobacter sp.]